MDYLDALDVSAVYSPQTSRNSLVRRISSDNVVLQHDVSLVHISLAGLAHMSSADMQKLGEREHGLKRNSSNVV